MSRMDVVLQVQCSPKIEVANLRPRRPRLTNRPKSLHAKEVQRTMFDGAS